MKLNRVITISGIALLVLLAFYLLFGINAWSYVFVIMSVSFLFLVPFGMGALVIYLSGIDRVKKLGYRIITPWIPVLAFFC
ncbi:hypothetical protein EOD41_17155 [Mucilaginibacter limnophilus]|uniref:Uncharacterized protein n=1 Tax=Mucilaginibacter limnophilus TaxID=1932778 RepID=A0A437MLI2_9SPHI|nr:hypothetical protein [Mucilaginibacter limnophilus]RVT98514.1 hypothetical protein EOD41_17155 [Mucilaginibacter limnophilus]